MNIQLGFFYTCVKNIKTTVTLNYYTNIKSFLNHLSYCAVVPRLPVYFYAYVLQTCSHLFIRSFSNSTWSDAYYFRAEKETTELRCAIKIVPPLPFSFLPLSFRCRGARAKQFTWVNSWLQLCCLPVPTTTVAVYQVGIDIGTISMNQSYQWISKKKTNKA